jgi:hypothetical protein
MQSRKGGIRGNDHRIKEGAKFIAKVVVIDKAGHEATRGWI